MSINKEILDKITWRPWCAACVHSWHSHDLNHLEPEGGNVVLDLVDVILRDALVLRLPLLLGDVSPHQVPHDRLILEISFSRLTLLSLEEELLTIMESTKYWISVHCIHVIIVSVAIRNIQFLRKCNFCNKKGINQDFLPSPFSSVPSSSYWILRKIECKPTWKYKTQSWELEWCWREVEPFPRLRNKRSKVYFLQISTQYQLSPKIYRKFKEACVKKIHLTVQRTLISNDFS